MNDWKLLGYLVAFVLATVAPFLLYRWLSAAWQTVKALRVLLRERRTGETLYDTAEALAGDAHNWRETSAWDASNPQKFGDSVAAAIAVGREMKPGELTVLPAVCRLLDDARKWREFEEVADAPALTLDGDANMVPASGVYTKAQPMPKNSDDRALWPLIISELGESETDRLVAVDMQQRHEFGVAKYGVPLVASNGRDHLADAYQEALDCVVYLRAAIESHLARTLEDTNTKELARTHQLYVDALDAAKEIRELIRERDGR